MASGWTDRDRGWGRGRAVSLSPALQTRSHEAPKLPALPAPREGARFRVHRVLLSRERSGTTAPLSRGREKVGHGTKATRSTKPVPLLATAGLPAGMQ